MNDNKIILGLVGEVASGKSAIAKYLADKYDAKVITFGQPLKDILTRLQLPQNRQNLIWLGEDLRHNFDKHILAKVAVRDADAAKNNVICFADVRIEEDIYELKNNPNFHLINIQVDQKTRYHRLVNRREKPDDQHKTWEEFLQESDMPTQSSIQAIASTAHYTIDNNGELDDAYQQVDAIMATLVN